MDYLSEIDLDDPKVTEHLDELSLWSAPFGMMMLNRVPMRRGVTILDVGCGTGFLTLELAQRCGPDSTIVAVDPWAPVMDRLRSKIAYLGLENVWLIQDDAANIDLPDSSADLSFRTLGSTTSTTQMLYSKLVFALRSLEDACSSPRMWSGTWASSTASS